MAIDFYWGSGSPPCWRVALALEFKRLTYNSHLLHFDRQEHKSPQMLAMNFRGRLPVLRDNDYVVFESLAILYYLDQQIPRSADIRPQRRGSRRDHARDLRVPVLCRAAAEADRRALLAARARRSMTRLAEAMHRVAGEARTIEQRLARSDWVVGESFSAADMMIYPDIRLLLRRPAAAGGARACGALPADGDQLSGHRALARSRGGAARARAHLAAALALKAAAQASAVAVSRRRSMRLATRRGDCYPCRSSRSRTDHEPARSTTSIFQGASLWSASAASARAFCR